MTQELATRPIVDWEAVAGAFLREKEGRSGSTNTVSCYRHLLARFFGELGKEPPAVTTADVAGFILRPGPGGKPASGATSAWRLAVIGSFYAFCGRMDLTVSNPCAGVARPRAAPPIPQGLSVEEIRRLLAACPDTCPGRRDRAIIEMLIYTGRRRAELLNLKVGDLSRNGGLYYSYRGKGGQLHRRELPPPAAAALLTWLESCRRPLDELGAAERVFDVSAQGFYMNLRRYYHKAGLPAAGVHVLRHSAAKLRVAAGETVEAVSRFLDHASLATTTRYLRQLEGEADRGWERVAALLRT